MEPELINGHGEGRAGFCMSDVLAPPAHVGPSAPGTPAKVAHAVWTHRWFALAVVIVVAGGAWQGGRILFGTEVVGDRVARGAIVETVVATGNVLTPYRANIGVQITGTVSDVLVEEGETVKKGQTLVTLENSEMQAAVVQTEGALEEAEARVRQLSELTLPTAKETFAQMQADLVDAQKTFDRADTLVKSGAETVANLDDARKALDVARAQVNAAQFAVYTASPGGSDYVLAQTQLRRRRPISRPPRPA